MSAATECVEPSYGVTRLALEDLQVATERFLCSGDSEMRHDLERALARTYSIERHAKHGSHDRD